MSPQKVCVGTQLSTSDEPHKEVWEGHLGMLGEDVHLQKP